MTATKDPTVATRCPSPVVLFGIDSRGKPKGARFGKEHASLAANSNSFIARKLQIHEHTALRIPEDNPKPVTDKNRFHGTQRCSTSAIQGDGSTTLDVRLVLKTRDDALITMTYRGLRHGPRSVIERIEKGEVVDPDSYYFRINPMFETASGNYDWINRVLAIGGGHRFADGPVYSVFEVL